KNTLPYGRSARNRPRSLSTVAEKGSALVSRRNHVPACSLHMQSGQAIVTLPDGRAYAGIFCWGSTVLRKVALSRRMSWRNEALTATIRPQAASTASLGILGFIAVQEKRKRK